MLKNFLEELKPKLSPTDYQKLSDINNNKVYQVIAEFSQICSPKEIFICSDSFEELNYIRKMAIESCEEKPLSIQGHSYHFDGIYDQGRDRKITKFLVPESETLSSSLNQINREEGLIEIKNLCKDIMNDKTMIVRFLTLGPINSPFTILCMECTDSWYVAHSVDLLYREGYKAFLKADKTSEFFVTLHSSGKLDKNMVSLDYNKKRIYIDYTQNLVYSVNTQYAGNSIGFKKLALRLAIRKAHNEGWLAEHFMMMGVHLKNNQKIYLAGAFPSACGKTSTAMLPGETILADDIAYVRNIDGVCRAVNVEKGIFGIIQNINPQDDPLIYDVLTKPGEIIFSNILVKDGKPYWLGMGKDLPKNGINYSGQWFEGKTENNEKIFPAHKNARYTVCLKFLANCDSELENPEGVEIGGIMYGGRDYHGYVPVQQGFDWIHGIIAYGAALETETTFAIVGQEGKHEINIMSIQDFVSISLGKYLKNYLEFGRKLKKTPLVFGVNYFLKDLKTANFLNTRRDKHVWIKWMALRANNDVDAIQIPTGLIPKYEDLCSLFKKLLAKKYSEEDYIKQFSLRIPENLAKLERVEKYYRENISDVPQEFFDVINHQRNRLLKVREELGEEYISPIKFIK